MTGFWTRQLVSDEDDIGYFMRSLFRESQWKNPKPIHKKTTT
jgi:hypothetical protein